MEDKENNMFEYFDGEDHAEDTLSLRNLPIHDHNLDGDSVRESPRTSSAFEFFTGLTSGTYNSPTTNLIFCGKVISDKDDEELNEYQKRDYLTLKRSASFIKPQSYQFIGDEKTVRFPTKNRSNSVRISSSDRYSSNCSTLQKVNITSLTSMSEKSKRWMFMFGPVKFKPEMELRAIKERQGRRVPPPMFPAIAGGAKGKSQWGIVRSLKGRSHLANVLARAFGCIPVNVV
ncbi:unnamed protein product [Ilex paraguariensis]|uniref:Uncharacterized protein n=1 Tax=Ilex paraguariensis TaxID=185542 RepID=A0ABC8SB03_9AQUA